MRDKVLRPPEYDPRNKVDLTGMGGGRWTGLQAQFESKRKVDCVVNIKIVELHEILTKKTHT